MDRRNNGQGNVHNGSRPAGQRGNSGSHNHNPGPMQQFRRCVAPVLQAQRDDQCKITTQGRRTEVVMPVVNGHGIMIAQVLVARHHAGDVSILEVCSPEGLKKQGANGVAVELRNNLQRGDHYERISVYKLWTGVVFQRWGYEGLNERVGAVTHHFPDIRRSSPQNLEKLSRFTGLRFGINLQIRWKEYQKIEDTRYAQHNHGAQALSVFNQQCLEEMNQTMNQIADVAWGTELKVARQLMAMQIASEGPDVRIDKTSPTLGFARDVDVETRAPQSDVVVDMVQPSVLVEQKESHVLV